MKFLKNLFQKPVIIINFKTYKQGKQVIKLAKQIEKATINSKYKIIIGIQPTDIYELAKLVKNKRSKIEIFSEHADYFKVGRNTGFILPEAIKVDGAQGTFLNHSEHHLDFDTLKLTIERCKKINLKTAVFVKNLSEAKKVEKIKPNYIIYEPPELVSGKISVSQAKPSIIKKFSETIKTRFLVGAGIHTEEDFKIALQLGASGIVISSAIVKAKNPGKKLMEMIG